MFSYYFATSFIFLFLFHLFIFFRFCAFLGILGGVPGFLEGVPGFLGGVPGFLGLFRGLGGVPCFLGVLGCSGVPGSTTCLGIGFFGGYILVQGLIGFCLKP